MKLALICLDNCQTHFLAITLEIQIYMDRPDDVIPENVIFDADSFDVKANELGLSL